MNTENVVRHLRVLWRTDRIIADIRLRHLLIGSEGTLVIITAASLRLFPEPAAQGAALMAVPDPSAALSLL